MELNWSCNWKIATMNQISPRQQLPSLKKNRNYRCEWPAEDSVKISNSASEPVGISNRNMIVFIQLQTKNLPLLFDGHFETSKFNRRVNTNIELLIHILGSNTIRDAVHITAQLLAKPVSLTSACIIYSS